MSDRDPRGRRALFEQQPVASEPTGEEGRRAFYTPPDPEPTGGVPVHCSRCGVRSYLTRRELARRVAMFTLWAPWRDHSRWIRCPACHHRAWCRVRWV